MALEHRALKLDAWLRWDPTFLDPEEADAWLARLRDDTPWEQLPIQVFGKPVMQPRLMAWAGALPYRYSGLTLEPRPVEGALAELLALVCEATGAPFNHVMLNLYRDGNDHIGMHADDERELGPDPTIASLSLGAPRRFVLAPKNKRRSKRREKLRLTHGSLLVMGGACQHAWYHGVPRQMDVTEPRINVTFRNLLGPPGWRPETA